MSSVKNYTKKREIKQFDLISRIDTHTGKVDLLYFILSKQSNGICCCMLYYPDDRARTRYSNNVGFGDMKLSLFECASERFQIISEIADEATD